MTYKALGNYIGGAWRLLGEDEATGRIERVNPSRRGEVVFGALYSAAHVDEAVAAAREAMGPWRRLGFEGRLEIIRRFGTHLEARCEELARAIATEVGKPLWESRGEARALGAKIEIMSTKGAQLVETTYLNGVDGRTIHRPLGVLAVLGPFNFPLHLPNGHVIPGLLHGNTVVIKPSELSGACMQLYLECAHEAGFPAGVINMVQGGGDVGAPLAAHEGVDAVLFTGSYETGLRIKEATLRQAHKLLALEMGGKNTSIVCAGADLDQAAHEIVLAAFGTCGQRCTATSRVVAEAAIIDPLIARVRALTRRITIGDPLGERDTFMGPIIDERAFERFLSSQRDDEQGNLEAILQGGAASIDGLDGFFVTPGIWRASALDAQGSHQSIEIFGPDLVFYEFTDDEQAQDIANATPYGLAMSVFTSDTGRFEALSDGLACGILNLNRSTSGASSALPFGGVKRSGNHRPAALWAPYYCTYPQAQLRLPAGFDAEASASGAFSTLAAPDETR